MYCKNSRLLPGFVCLAMLVAFTSRAAAQAAAEKEGQFLRFVDDNEGGGRLEAAVVTYQNAAGATVHLVSAVHVGERKYYADLSRDFRQYDALLYEMVKPRNAPVPGPGVQSDSMVSMFQRVLKDVLALEFQLDAINYTARNFVHADLDAETFTRLQAERGENLVTLMLRVMLDEMSRPQQMPEVTLVELLVALTSPDSARHFKLILGRQFQDMEAKVAGLEGKTGSVILTERNKACIAVLKDELAKGKKNIGIFYGAAHMADLDKRVRELGFKPVKTDWRVAWDMTAKEGDVIIKIKRADPQAPAQPERAPQPANR